jgi:arginyl-tRNA--protein-N-Asp/Glu arginylyltransferase
MTKKFTSTKKDYNRVIKNNSLKITVYLYHYISYVQTEIKIKLISYDLSRGTHPVISLFFWFFNPDFDFT